MMGRVRGIEAASEIKASNVRAIFQSTHHYTSVIHQLNGLLSFYDEKTMSIVAVSRAYFPQAIQLLSFSNRYGQFYTYFDAATRNSSKNPSSPHLTVFAMKEFGRLESYNRMISKEETTGSASAVRSMATLVHSHKPSSQEILVLFEQQRYRVISRLGQALALGEIVLNGREANVSQSYHLSEDKFILVEASSVISAKFSNLQFSFQEELRFEGGIENSFMDSAIHKKYLGIVTRDQLLHIVSMGNKCTVCYIFAIPSLIITQLSFFYPGVNTSSTNKFKDRIYAVLQGVHLPQSSERPNEKQLMIPTENFLSGSSFSSSKVYIFEFKQCCLAGSLTPFKLKPQGQFSLETGAVRQLLFNQHQLNCLRAVTESGQLVSYALSFLFDGAQVDAEWIYLAFRFQHCSGGQSFELEPREDEFERRPYQRDRKIAEEELDDWSYSCFGPKELASLRQRRTNCISDL